MYSTEQKPAPPPNITKSIDEMRTLYFIKTYGTL